MNEIKMPFGVYYLNTIKGGNGGDGKVFILEHPRRCRC